MTTDELRTTFLQFFKERDHTVVPSSPLTPDDPSVLFTTAGMQQFKSYYTGELDPETTQHPRLDGPVGRNAASAQKSFRTSDIEEVGDDAHLTFFEMLGNFSFGGYFKEEAIGYAYEFLVEELGLTIDYVTVFEGDDDVPADEEAEAAWRALGVEDIRRDSREENWWGPTGTEGPCGPTTEVFIGDTEVWNIVFNEFYCNADGTLERLETPGIDTGMGLERLAQIVQGTNNVFETDAFKALMDRLAGMMVTEELESGSPFDVLFRPDQALEIEIASALERSKALRALRVVADHLRGAVFLIADGVRPSNQEQGYVVRRLLRRAIRSARQLAMPDDFYQDGIEAVVDAYGDFYNELNECHETIRSVVGEEAETFGSALQRGEKAFADLLEAYGDETVVSGTDAFDLYQSYGFPIELTEEMAAEHGLTVDRDGFEEALEEHREASRAGSEAKFGGHGLALDTGELKARDDEEVQTVTKLHTATHLIHAALRSVLGDHVEQRGSDINADRLRFDFSHPEAMTDAEIAEVEEMVNKAITQDLSVASEEMPLEEAMESGALAFFKAKYPEVVTVYTVGDPDDPFSKEICGGPHVERTGVIGGIDIFKEQSSGAGVRRIRARLSDRGSEDASS